MHKNARKKSYHGDGTSRVIPEKKTISVVIADDHPIVLAGLRMMIEKAEDISIVDEVYDGQSAIDSIKLHLPAVALLDIEMPLMTGLDVMRELQHQRLPTHSIVLTLYDERDVFEQAMTLGAKGYILKDSAPQDIVRGIRRVSEGDCFISPKIGENIHPSHQKIHDAIESLTRRERRVLHLIAQDKSTREIAEMLFISPRTVDHHRSNICSKLGISGCFALMRFALEHRLLF